MNQRVLLAFLLGCFVAAAMSCNFISPECSPANTPNGGCPSGAYCNAQYQVCFEIIPDAGSDAAVPDGGPTDASGADAGVSGDL